MSVSVIVSAQFPTLLSDSGAQTVTNTGPDSVYYKAAGSVAANSYDGVLTAGGSLPILSATAFLAQSSYAILNVGPTILAPGNVKTSDVGQAGGVAVLDGSVLVPVAQVPFLPYIGPKPTGSDDTTNLQNAITAAAAAGRQLLLYPGTYLLTSILSIPSGLAIEGAGIALTTLQWKTGAGAMPGSNSPALGSGLLKLDSVSNVSVSHLTVDANRAGNTNVNLNCIYIIFGTDIRLERVGMQNADANGGTNGEFGNGLRCVQQLSSGFACERIVVRNCNANGIRSSYGMQFSGNPKRCIVTENEIWDCQNGVDFSTGNYNVCSNNAVRDINVATSGIALSFTNSQYMLCSGNALSNVYNGIGGNGNGSTGNGSGLAVTGNSITGVSTAQGCGINFTGALSTNQRTISGNYVQSFATGIKLDGTTFNTVTGNALNATPIGIDLVNACDHNNIVGNVMKSASTASIRLGASTTKNNVKSNQVGGSAAIADTGTGNDTTGNFTTA